MTKHPAIIYIVLLIGGLVTVIYAGAGDVARNAGELILANELRNTSIGFFALTVFLVILFAVLLKERE
jgi:hypothetical protein